MSEVKVNKISPRTACGTVTLGDSGDTFTIPSGATITNLGTSTGFGGTGVVSWDTSSIKTAGFVAVTGTGYFCNTTGGAFTVTLPASPSAGDVVGVSDYAKTFDTYNLTLGKNSEKIGGVAEDAIIAVEGIAVTLVYVDSTKGWIVTDSGNQSDAPAPIFIAATGGCITTCGNFKMHTYFAPGTFLVSCAGNPAGSNTVDYLVVGGGGGGSVGGGGAGGYRESPGTASGCYTVSPRGVAPAVALPVSATPYAIVVGGGGPKSPGPEQTGGAGVDSSFSTITSAGGGGGGNYVGPGPGEGVPGGSGGGGGGLNSPSNTPAGGSGNVPVQDPVQGTDGGEGSYDAPSHTAGGGGGGALVVGCDAPAAGSPSTSSTGGTGGAGGGTAINLTTMPAPSPTPSTQIGTPGPSPSVRYFSGGAGGGVNTTGCGGTPVPGGVGGGGTGVSPAGSSTAGTINTGGGGGGYAPGPAPTGASAGGSGIVVIRYKYQ